MVDKQKLSYTGKKEVLKEQAGLLCKSACGLLLFQPTDTLHWINWSVN